jgi:hypothetical protein
VIGLRKRGYSSSVSSSSSGIRAGTTECCNRIGARVAGQLRSLRNQSPALATTPSP